jgi:FKBP-type peptidyl-prolyl cis-trans isomerase SlyD
MTVTKNRVVSIDYTLLDDKHNVIESTSGQRPLDYLHGFGNIIPGLEKMLEGRAQGERFVADVPAAEAYGERDERLIADIPMENFQGLGDDQIRPGMRFHTQSDEGVRMITVTRVENGTVTVDGNHPLAGMDLSFEVTVSGIREASEDELMHGHVHNAAHDHCGCGEGGDGCGGGCGHDDCGCGGHGSC